MRGISSGRREIFCLKITPSSP